MGRLAYEWRRRRRGGTGARVRAGGAGRFPPAGSVSALRRGDPVGDGVREPGVRPGGPAEPEGAPGGRETEAAARAGLRSPAARACPHCAEGATEANAGLKVAPPAKVARVPPGPRPRDLARGWGRWVALGIASFSSSWEAPPPPS